MSGCPSTSLEVKASSERLKCVQPEVYHCLRNQVGEKTEKCIKPSWIQRGLCAEYNTIAERLDAKGCQPSRGLCPDKAYLSNDVISFSGCAPNEVVVTTINTTSSNDIHFESHDDGLSTIIIAITCIIVICIIALGVGVFIYFRRKRRAGNTNKDGENTDLLLEEKDGHSKKNDREVQKNKHLEKEEEHLKYFDCKGECPKHMLETIKGHLQRHENVLIIGKPGSGKTTLAWTVCKQMHGESFEGQRWYVKASTSTKNLPNEKAMTLILLLDGRFENAWTTEEMVKNTFDELEELRQKLPSTNILTIATLSKQAFQRASKFGCIEKLKPKEIMDLDSKTNTLTYAEMTEVLDAYDIQVKNVKGAKESKDLSQKQLRAIYECLNHSELSLKNFYQIPKIGFPLIASLMSLNTHFLGNMKFIREPIEHALHSIKQLRESQELASMNKYCTIVYASFKEGKVDTNNVDKGLLTKIGTLHGNPEVEIDPDFYILRNIRETVYEFLHESLLRAFFSAYGKQYMGFVINNCPLNVLLQYSVSVRENISRKEDMFFMTIGGPDFEGALIHRIINEKFDIRHHRMWEQNVFKENYKKIYAEGEEL